MERIKTHLEETSTERKQKMTSLEVNKIVVKSVCNYLFEGVIT